MRFPQMPDESAIRCVAIAYNEIVATANKRTRQLKQTKKIPPRPSMKKIEIAATRESQFIFCPRTNSRTYKPQLTGLDLRDAKYKQVFTECSVQLCAYFDAAQEQNGGRITRKDIVCISQQIGLPLKTTCEFLEHLEKLPTGTWERKFADINIKDWTLMYAEQPQA